MPTFFRRSPLRHVLSWAVLTVTAFSSFAQAPDYPSRPVKLVVPYTPGGTADTLARMMAAGMQEPLGQSMVVENRSGAGAVIGATHVARSAADGYTLLLGAGSTHTTPQVVMKKMPYDPLKDFEPIAMIGTTSYVLLARPTLPFKNLQETLAYAKENPGKISYGSTGPGAAVHLTMAHVEQLAGVRLLQVPYRGGGQILVDLMAGQIDLGLGTAESAGAVESGKLRALAVIGPKRLSALPDVPTCIESGVPNCEFPVWNGLFAPTGTPQAVMSKLTAAAEHVLAEPQTQKRLRELGYEPAPPGGPTMVKRHIANETRLVHQVATKAGVMAE
ncbi:MAG: tripartite tricarboxylate transporter substrate binding protein [Proteobacteria bacterium]|nr:tripartite tricarboxylate transporter substrate binding protein [Pseudomonadota bacterium]